MRYSLLFLVSMLLLSACETTDHEGYKRYQDSVHIKLLEVGDDNAIINADSYVTVDVSLSDLQGKAIANKRIDQVPFASMDLPDVIKRILEEKRQDDRISVRGRVDALELEQWFSPLVFEDPSDILSIELSVVSVLSDDELRQLRSERRLSDDRELEALQCTQMAMDSLGFSEADQNDGIYFKRIRSGNGLRPATGKLARVQYKTYLCDGSLVDDTYRSEELFEYPIGKPDQVLDGFSIAISFMREGDKALFLIPPSLAYGDKGSSSGIVPPHAALIYEAELVEVR